MVFFPSISDTQRGSFFAHLRLGYKKIDVNRITEALKNSKRGGSVMIFSDFFATFTKRPQRFGAVVIDYLLLTIDDERVTNFSQRMGIMLVLKRELF
jgi:hypothetical protein